jgi:UDP-N-acetylglucosamine 2-epimerase (non-hydrolysing)
LTVFGTRPEAIKMAPVVQALDRLGARVRPLICVTGQHRHMLDQVLALFGLRPDFDLDVMRPDQGLGDLTTAVLAGIGKVLRDVRPAYVIVQGDTTTTFASSLAAFYERVPVAHVEAGLRTGNPLAPWPEEINRRLTTAMASLHLAPTEGARANLLREGVLPDRIHVTGNTVVDALQVMAGRIDHDATLRSRIERQFGFLRPERRLVLVTAHRRENFGAGFDQICLAIREIARRHEDVEVVYPVHLNPHVREPVCRLLGNVGAGGPGAGGAAGGAGTWEGRVHLIEPVEYLPFIALMRRARLLITDSGGIQEEATALGRPVLVMRDVTERPEAIAAGAARLVGTDADRIVAETDRLLSDEATYASAARATAVFGDGHAGTRIAEILERELARSVPLCGS